MPLSQKKAFADRNEADSYMTPGAVSLAICDRVSELMPSPPRYVIEPSAGTGSFVRAVRSVWGREVRLLVANDIQPKYKPLLFDAGATVVRIQDWEDALWLDGLHPVDLVVGNPPFSRAEKHIRKALRRVRIGGWVAFLLRMSFFGSQKRNSGHGIWTRAGLRWWIPVAERISFSGAKHADNSEYAVYVWERGYKGNAEKPLNPIWWRAYQ